MTTTAQAGTANTTTPAPGNDERRLLVLAAAVREQEGPWTTRRVQRLYRALGYDNGPLRRIARRDLHQLAQEGLLVLHDEDPGRRHYTRKEGA